MFLRNGLALLNTMIFMIIFSIIAGVVLIVVSNQTRLLENHIRRTKAYYLVEAGSVAAMDSLRRGAAISNPNVEWTFDPLTGTPTGTRTPSVTTEVNLGIDVTTRVNASFDYELSW